MLTTTNKNSNYLAQVISLPTLRKHSNADKLQCFNWQGNNIITGLSASEGQIYIYIPVEAAINKEYLSWSNSFSNETTNKDGKTKGFFDKHGRVKCLKLRGEISSGYVIPIKDVENFFADKGIHVNFSDYIGQEFDTVGQILFCEKYIIKSQPQGAQKKKTPALRRFNKVISENFFFHSETPHLGRSLHLIDPESVISITTKYHGTSFGVKKILCRKKMNWWQRILNKIHPIQNQYYDIVWHSRKVIKNAFEDPKPGFYQKDLWADIADIYKEKMTEGLCLFGEAVGYVPGSQKMIQKDYDYACREQSFDTYIYRINYCSPNGDVYELSWPQIKAWCADNGFKHVRELYYGKAKDLFPQLDASKHWQQNFFKELETSYLEKVCDICKNKVPAEGITVRLDDGRNWKIFKLKSEAFKLRETKLLDEGESDIESSEES